MGYTAVLTMIIILITSLIQHKGEDDKKGIPISKQLFKTPPLFNIGSFAIMIILVAIYAVFWK